MRKMAYEGTYVLVQELKRLIPGIQSVPERRHKDKSRIGCLSVQLAPIHASTRVVDAGMQCFGIRSSSFARGVVGDKGGVFWGANHVDR
jgi:hypothetical protein